MGKGKIYTSLIISTIAHTHQRVQRELAGSQEIRFLQTPGTEIQESNFVSIKIKVLLWITMATHPSPVASIVVAFKQTVNERTPAALDQRVRVP